MSVRPLPSLVLPTSTTMRKMKDMRRQKEVKRASSRRVRVARLMSDFDRDSLGWCFSVDSLLEVSSLLFLPNIAMTGGFCRCTGQARGQMESDSRIAMWGRGLSDAPKLS